MRGFRFGAWGCVDLVRPNDAGGLYVCGWAASLDDATIEAVDVTVDGRTQACRTGLAPQDFETAVIGTWLGVAHGVDALLARDRDFSLFAELRTRDPLA